MNKPIPHTPFLAADFQDAQGVRVRNFQQVDESGKAYALADFEGAQCLRIGGVFSQRAKVEAFLKEVAQLVKCTNPEKMAIKWEGAPGYVEQSNPGGELISAPLFARNGA